MGRFINADGIIGQTGDFVGHNLFAYCKNNTVNRVDHDGYRDVTLEQWEEKEVSVVDKVLLGVSEFLGKPEGKAVSTVISTLINGGIAASMTTAISRSWDSKGWYQELPSGLTREIGRFVQPSKALSLVNKAANIGLGAIAVLATGLSIWDNYAHYRENDARGRTIIDLLSVSATVGSALFMAGSLTLTGSAAIGAGFAAEWQSVHWQLMLKTNFIGEKNKRGCVQ